MYTCMCIFSVLNNEVCTLHLCPIHAYTRIYACKHIYVNLVCMVYYIMGSAPIAKNIHDIHRVPYIIHSYIYRVYTYCVYMLYIYSVPHNGVCSRSHAHACRRVSRHVVTLKTVCVYACVCTRVWAYAYVHVCVTLCVWTIVCVCVHGFHATLLPSKLCVCVCAHVHLHILTHIHMHILNRESWSTTRLEY